MKLTCVSRYQSSLGRWEPGADVDVSDDVAALLLRDSPESFTDRVAPRTNPEPVAEDVREEVAAMSTETVSDLVVPDRQMKSGRRRRKPASG